MTKGEIMIHRMLAIILLALPLLSIAPVPAARPTISRTRIAVQTSGARITIHAKVMQQACTFETATSRLRQEIADPIGYPYGFVTAWSCTGDGFAVAQELATRASAMQAEAAAYRAAHPIVGLR